MLAAVAQCVPPAGSPGVPPGVRAAARRCRNSQPGRTALQGSWKEEGVLSFLSPKVTALQGSWKEEGVLSFLSPKVTRRDLSHEPRRSHRAGVLRPVRAGHPALSAETAAAARRGLDLDVLGNNPARRTNHHFHYQTQETAVAPAATALHHA